MFMIACNCIFDLVKKYYFDWMIVVLPTILVCIMANFYEILMVNQKKGFFVKRNNVYTEKKGSYSMSDSNLV